MIPSWLRRGALGVCAAAALVASPTVAQSSLQNGQSTFVSPDKSLMFGFTIPTDATDDVYVTLRASIGLEWAAVGIGQDNMAGSLIMMIYVNSAGNNVTFSPRVAYGNYEPVPYSGLDYTVLNGTGLYDDHMVFSMRCNSGCRNWPGGYVDTSSPDQKAIYAIGPLGGFSSDDPAAGVRYHQQYGTFHIDMKRTTGADDAPFLDDNVVSEGTTLGTVNDDQWDYKSAMHATFMLFCFVVLLPVGVLMLKIGGWVRWHMFNQAAALVGVLLGLLLGILASFLYQRSRGFNTPHQIIGLIVTGLLVAQFAIGFLNHQRYKRTQRRSKLAVPHVWLGRFVILLGIVNAFLGFSLAIVPRNSYILAGLIIVFFPACFFLILYRERMRRRRMNGGAAGGPAGAAPLGSQGPPPAYDGPAWRPVDAQSPGYHGHQPSPAYGASPTYRDGAEAPYDAPPQQVGLADLDLESERRKETAPGAGARVERGAGSSRAADLGPEARPRELV